MIFDDVYCVYGVYTSMVMPRLVTLCPEISQHKRPLIWRAIEPDELKSGFFSWFRYYFFIAFGKTVDVNN
jgi:hypothetical protein